MNKMKYQDEHRAYCWCRWVNRTQRFNVNTATATTASTTTTTTTTEGTTVCHRCDHVSNRTRERSPPSPLPAALEKVRNTITWNKPRVLWRVSSFVENREKKKKKKQAGNRVSGVFWPPLKKGEMINTILVQHGKTWSRRDSVTVEKWEKKNKYRVRKRVLWGDSSSVEYGQYKKYEGKKRVFWRVSSFAVNGEARNCRWGNCVFYLVFFVENGETRNSSVG